MARNAELIRQWHILRAIDGARLGIPIQKLASERNAHQRTIRRDLEALQKAGFPLYDEKVNGTSLWRLQPNGFKGLENTTWSLTELCALYFSRATMGAVAGAPFDPDFALAFAKLDKALPAQMRRSLDRLPSLIEAKPAPRKKQDSRKVREHLARAMDASLDQRRVQMRYASASSGRAKDYLVEPHRLTFADGGMYL